ncbi:MAG: PAS domain S-box protein [Halodesulfurarchaeum sp.]
MAPADSIPVLVVVDEPSFQEMVAAQLEAEEPVLDVETASSVEEGLEIVEEGAVECVISEYDLPHRDGIEFLQAVRETHPGFPFVLLTGDGSESLASEAIRAGVTAYFPKRLFPEQFSVLANRVADAVASFRTERELERRRRELETYEHMLHSMPESAALYDAEERFQFVNDYLVEWYGKPREELLGAKSNLISKVRDRHEGDPFEALFDGEERTLSGTIEGDFPGHGTAVLEYRFRPLLIDDAVEGLIGTTQDVTERHRRTRELRRAKETFESLFDGMNETAWVIDTDGAIMAVNESAVEVLDYDRETLMGMTPVDLDPEMSPGAIQRLIEDLPEEEVQVFETVHETAEGRKIPVEVSSSMVTYRGERAILSVARDVSSRKERERRLEQFASVVSHDLRNPLNVAKGYLNLAAEDCESDHLDAVAEAHHQMEALIADLLTLARGEEGLSVGPVPLLEVVEQAWAGTETADASLSIDVGGTVVADRDRLRRLFENLLRNAVEHATGNVSIRVGRLPEGFFVADDGPGIEPADRERVFETGYSTAEDGTGIGLSIVDQVATAHGWTIDIAESDRGGARFEVTDVEFRAE